LFNRNILMSGPISKRRDNFPIILQHDIPLEYNHMGGPVFNLEGECVGINIARVDRVTNYAIPSYLVGPILSEWVEN
jgi:serine protease Do